MQGNRLHVLSSSRRIVAEAPEAEEHTEEIKDVTAVMKTIQLCCGFELVVFWALH
jgi:hypothetical protein